MMGPYYYYEDVSPEIHDCMWSGECYSCQQDSCGSTTAVPITLGYESSAVSTAASPSSPSSPSSSTSPASNGPEDDEKHLILDTKKHLMQDNKKLRHREVEKNRHRQLQAMVKTLSEKIPGRLDKETQVQTMKRAARYCVYLREVYNTLISHGHNGVAKERLEKLYLRSYEKVEHIMSQNAAH